MKLKKINRNFTERNEGYVLIGPRTMGFKRHCARHTVKWPHISSARLIVESSLKNYRIEPSQGTHFFQNPDIVWCRILYDRPVV